MATHTAASVPPESARKISGVFAKRAATFGNFLLKGSEVLRRIPEVVPEIAPAVR